MTTASGTITWEALADRPPPIRVAFQGDTELCNALAHATDRMILSPVETNLEIAARMSQADVMVVDATHDLQRSLQSIKEITYDRPLLALVSSGHENVALSAGSSGVILKGSKTAAIAAAIEAVHMGLAVVGTPTQAHLSADMHARVQGAASETLTPREGEVLGLLADGLSNKEIAANLGISEHTAKFHVNSILQKMHAQKRVAAVVRAAKMGILDI